MAKLQRKYDGKKWLTTPVLAVAASLRDSGGGRRTAGGRRSQESGQGQRKPRRAARRRRVGRLRPVAHADPRVALLSSRELETMRGLAEDRSIAELAEAIGVSHESINTYKRRMFHKMGFADKAEMLEYLEHHEAPWPATARKPKRAAVPYTEAKKLSQRELTVLARLAAGQTYPVIAHALGIKKSTVKTFKERLFRKMGFKTNVDLVRYATRHELIAPPPVETVDWLHDEVMVGPRLTKRELEVLSFLAMGMSRSMIAQTLGLSPSTIKCVRERLYKKMRFTDRSDLMRCWLEEKARHTGAEGKTRG